MPQVVTCLLENKGKILILKRSEKVLTYKGMWGGVAGYVEKNEKPIQTSIKEIYEEVGLTEKDIKFINKLSPIKFKDTHCGKEYDWIIFPFLYSVDDKNKIKIDWEHSDYKWIFPSEISDYDTVPHLDEIVKKFYG
jgi:8-oxo-dGTP pyrophosphatase MutT (NUDIX family)